MITKESNSYDSNIEEGEGDEEEEGREVEEVKEEEKGKIYNNKNNEVNDDGEEEEEEEKDEKENNKEEEKESNNSQNNYINYKNIKDKTVYIPKEEEKESKDNKSSNKSNNKINNKNNNNYSNNISINNDNKERKLNLMVMIIPKVNKDLPLPLNILYFFLELFSYENNLKLLTAEDNKLVFYLMNIDWLNELKTYYNYNCIEFIVKRELKENKNFINRINDILDNINPSKLFEDYKLINKFNNIIINPKRIKKKFVDKEEMFSPKKVEYDVIKINKNIISSKLDYLDYFTYYPKCVLINERMRNILYLEYKYLKFSQFQKGDITLVDDKIYIKLTNKIVEVCSYETRNLIITPLYILYYFDISNIPFWENVLYDKKDFRKDYLLKRIYKDNKHIQCMFDPYNKEYIGYSINLNIPYGGEPIKEYEFLDNMSNNRNLPDDEEIQNAVDKISKFNLDGYYDNKFKETKKNKEEDTENKFMQKMKIMRKQKEGEAKKKKKKYIETMNKFLKTNKTESEKTVNSFVNVNGEIIGFVQGDEVSKNGEGYVRDSISSEILSNYEIGDEYKYNNENNEKSINKIREEEEEENEEYYY